MGEYFTGRNDGIDKHRVFLTYDLSPNQTSAAIISGNSNGSLLTTTSIDGQCFDLPNTTLRHLGTVKSALDAFKSSLRESGVSFAYVSKILIVDTVTNNNYIYNA